MQWEQECLRDGSIHGCEDRFALHDAASHQLTYIFGEQMGHLSKYHKIMHQQRYILAIFLFQEKYDHLSGPIDKWSISKFVTFIFNHLLRSEVFSFSVAIVWDILGIHLRHISTHIYTPFLADCLKRILKEIFPDVFDLPHI